MKTHKEKTVAFCGTRGVPANYGGFETAVDEISQRFVESGYDCVVFCRTSAGGGTPKTHRGRGLVHVKGSPVRSLDTFVSSLQTGWHLLRHRERYGHVFWFNNANLPGILLTLLAGLPTSVNTDGMEWRRAKWSWPFKAYYFLSSFLISRVCECLISDSRAVQDYYRRVFLKKTHFIPYGVPRTSVVGRKERSEVLHAYGLQPGRYYLQITRFEPDNLALDTALAFRATRLSEDGFRFLLIGYQCDTPYARRIAALSGGGGVQVEDAVYDAGVVAVLRENCFCYVHGNTVGGTNPALLEAMETCPRVLAVDGPFSREVMGDDGRFFTREGMVDAFRGVLACPDGTALQERVRSLYQWDAVVKSYVRLMEGKPANYVPTKFEPARGRPQRAPIMERGS
jgi:hypothetical protein